MTTERARSNGRGFSLLGKARVGQCPPPECFVSVGRSDSVAGNAARCIAPKTAYDQPGGKNHEWQWIARVIAVAAGWRAAAWHAVERARSGTGAAHRLHRAEDRHLLAARHRHAERLPDVSGRAQ